MAVAKKSEKVTNFGNFIIIIWYFSKGLLCSTKGAPDSLCYGTTAQWPVKVGFYER